MDAFSQLPTISASDLASRASAFANNLAGQLEVLNRQYPTAEMSAEAKEVLEKTFGGTIPGSTPHDFIHVFEHLFCRYMASRWVIIPE
jgi:hypothetical protein